MHKMFNQVVASKDRLPELDGSSFIVRVSLAVGYIRCRYEQIRDLGQGSRTHARNAGGDDPKAGNRDDFIG